MTADPRRFLYRSLDPDGAKRLAAKHLTPCDDGELFLQYSASEAFGFDDGRLKTADYNSSSGFGLRGVTGETTAFAHANEISEAAIERVAQVSVALAASWSVIDIVRADGFVAHDVRPLVRLGVQIVVEQNGRRETGYHGLGGRYLYGKLFDEAEWNRAIDVALAQALVNLQSVAAPAGEMPVVMGSGWAGVILHEAIGHGLEGDFNRKGTSAFSGRIGDRVATEGVTIVDDGAMEQRRGSLTIDDEGTPTGRTVLIEDGILKGYLQDRLNARVMGMAATG